MVSLKRSAFQSEAESRPSKQARASSADRDVRDAAAGNIDKDPTTPRRDPSAYLQRPSTTDLPTRPHVVLDDSEHPWPEGQYHPDIVPNSDETTSIRSTSSGHDDDPHTDESVFNDRDDMPSIADRRNLVSNAAGAFVIIPQSPRVTVLDEGNTPEDTGLTRATKPRPQPAGILLRFTTARTSTASRKSSTIPPTLRTSSPRATKPGQQDRPASHPQPARMLLRFTTARTSTANRRTSTIPPTPRPS